MIPKIIHYCWFGHNPLPEEAKKCIASWKKYFPDYEIKEWNEDNFNVHIIPYTSEAYNAKKYAFVSDYARFWILYNYGGIYFDTDVEVIKSLDDIVSLGNFMGYECPSVNNSIPVDIAPGLGLGATPKFHIIKRIMEIYEKKHFIENGKINTSITVVNYTSDLLREIGIQKYKDTIDKVGELYIYYPEYFCPLNHHTNILHITKNTRTIHHYTASWHSKSEKLKLKIAKILGPSITKLIVAIKHGLLRKQ